MAFNLGFSGGGASFSYTNRPFFDFFSFGSIEEIVIFLAVFLMSFAFIYFALKKFFTEKTKGGVDLNTGEWRKAGTKVGNKNILLVLSLSMAVLVTFGLMRAGWLFFYFGDIAGMVGLAIVSVLALVILYGVFQFLEKNFGSTIVAAGISVALIWFSFSYLLTNNILSAGPSAFVADKLSAIGSFWFAIIVTVVIVVMTKLRKKP
ncbi:hypothetical protein HN747_04585 [archaeon]|jgi:hypothetical protein|nr:hypothetical protein [archaeon]